MHRRKLQVILAAHASRSQPLKLKDAQADYLNTVALRQLIGEEAQPTIRTEADLTRANRSVTGTAW